MRPATDQEWPAEARGGGLRLYDGISLLLLMWPATGGMGLLGSTRTWGFAPGLVLSLLGSLLVFARPLVFAGTPRWRVPPGFWGFALLTLYIVVSVPTAFVPVAARWEALRWFALLAAAWAWTQTGLRSRRWQWLLGVLLLAAALESLYALVQHVNDSRMVLWTERPEQYGSRASGTFRCPNHFANVLAMLLPLALGLLFLPEAGFPLRLMAVYFTAVALPTLYWSQSRSAWGGVTAGLLLTGLLLAWRRGRRWLLLALVALPLLAAGAGWTAWKLLPGVQVRIQEVLDKKSAAAGVRIPMWKDAPAMMRDRPLTGFGGGSFVWAYPPYQVHVRQHLTWDYLHNEYLQMQVEYGAIGSGLLLLGLLWLGMGTVRGILQARERAMAVLLACAAGGLASSLVHALFDFNFHIFPNPHMLVWIGGVAWGAWFLHEQGAESVRERGRRLRWGAAVAGVAACAYGAWLALAGGLSYFWNLKGELARSRLEPEAAAAAFQRAIRWDSANGQPHLGLGNIELAAAVWYRDPDPEAERAGRQARAEAAQVHFRRVRELNPGEMAAVFGLGRAAELQGDSEAALREFRRAAAYQRRHVFYREQLGVRLRRAGRDAEALEVFRQNVADGVAGEVTLLNLRALERKLGPAAVAAPAPP